MAKRTISQSECSAALRHFAYDSSSLRLDESCVKRFVLCGENRIIPASTESEGRALGES